MSHGLQIDPEFAAFVEAEMLDGLALSPAQFWQLLEDLVTKFAPQNAALLAKRQDIQAQIDAWHQSHPQPQDPEAYEAFLREIGYLVPQGDAFEIGTPGVDPEVAKVAGPQLVVPITNARFALNAANARWGSLYDALYGTDALGDLPQGGGYDAARGARVIDWARGFLDEAAPLAGGSHRDAQSYALRDGALVVTLENGETALADPAQLVGYMGAPEAPSGVILVHNGLHVIIEIDRAHSIGKTDPAGVSDVRLEAALSVIMDCEDSVAAVDGPDKALAYRNWLGLMRGDLSVSFDRGGKTVARALEPDVAFTRADGRAGSLKGRALIFVRNVGHLMTTPAVRDASGAEIPEGILDALSTVAIALHDRKTGGNSAHGSVYVVKPKMHGPEEVAFADALFAAVEDALELPRNTVKIGLMDEERRTSANLHECIRAAKDRIAFVNTGFLDRTGDEIHSSMEAGPMVRKAEMKTQPWLLSYEDRNVDIALACGFQGTAQIGKGMWAMPDRMGDMLEAKIGHPESGASCAWVPSPTAAVLHAVHYHRCDVQARQSALRAGGARATLRDLLTLPLLTRNLPPEEIREELRNNAQGILGYVVRWVDQGVGCSKVPDINDVGQMEDRATCRISAQMMANWLRHGVVSRDEIMRALHEMALVVDRQNAGDPAYRPMGDGSASLAFQAARDLVLEGAAQPSGYTEPLLHAYRLKLKAADA